MAWDSEVDTAFCCNCGQQCRPVQYTRLPEDWELPGALVKDWRSSCCKDEVSADPISPVCEMCGRCQPPDEVDQLTWPNCEQCRAEVYCPECAAKHFKVIGLKVVGPACYEKLMKGGVKK